MKRLLTVFALLGAFGLSACADTYGYNAPGDGRYYNQGYGPGYYNGGDYGYGDRSGYYRGDGDSDDGPDR